MNETPNFRGDYWFLSNFYPSEIEYEGIKYSCVENAFQAAKSDDPEFKVAISRVAPALSKKLGNETRLTSGWDLKKDRIMKELVGKKFATGSTLARRLMGLEGVKIVENNDHRDVYWGRYKGKGQDKLGGILRDRRELLLRAP